MSVVALSKTLAPFAGSDAAVRPDAPAKGVLARIVDAVIAARTAQAEREVARYLALRNPGDRH